MNLDVQITFLKEIDKLKHIIRQTILVDGSRKENTAEHSWHIALAALVLSEYADEPVDVLRVIKMLLIHDIVEIDAGDTFAFDEVGYEDKEEREQQAAERIFGLLSNGQGDELKALWYEFEDRQTPDAKFAVAIDRLLPFLHNIWTEGGASWKEHSPTFEQVYRRNVEGVGNASTALWDYVKQLMDDANEKGWINSDKK
jgi:putative hydrolases of HD superfamily